MLENEKLNLTARSPKVTVKLQNKPIYREPE